jgi:hypothetical protein
MHAAGMQEDYVQDFPGAGTHIIHGVAIVVPVATDFPLTPLTRLTAEQHTAAQVWDDTCSYFWDVVDVLPFRTGIVGTDSGVRRCTIFTLDAHSLETARAALAEQNDSWIDAHGCLQPTSAVTLPPVLVQLILQKLWLCIPLHHSNNFRCTSDLHKWRRKVTKATRGEDRLRIDAAQAAIQQQLHDPPGEAGAIAAAQWQCTHLGIAALLDMVRAWRGMLIGEDPWDGSEEEANFEEAISILIGVNNEISFAGTQQANRQVSATGGFRYKLAFLIKTVLLCGNVRDTRKIRDVLHQAIALICPPALAGAFLRTLTNVRYSVPSASTICHARFCCDMTLLLSQRALFASICGIDREHSPLLLAMTDSSPQGRYNWQNTLFSLIKAEDLLDVGRSAVQLVRLRVDCRENVETSDAELGCLSALASKIRNFYCTCAALGSRRASLGHKLHAILHQCFMMTGTPPLLQKVCASIASWTVDLGVESLVNTTQPVGFDEVFPYFCQTAVEDEDIPSSYWQT